MCARVGDTASEYLDIFEAQKYVDLSNPRRIAYIAFSVDTSFQMTSFRCISHKVELFDTSIKTYISRGGMGKLPVGHAYATTAESPYIQGTRGEQDTSNCRQLVCVAGERRVPVRFFCAVTNKKLKFARDPEIHELTKRERSREHVTTPNATGAATKKCLRTGTGGGGVLICCLS